MAKITTGQQKRLSASYKAYKKEIAAYEKRGLAYSKATYSEYKRYFLRASEQKEKNIARTYARNVSLTTSEDEARESINKIYEFIDKNDIPKEDRITNREWRAMTGQQQFQYLLDLGLDEGEAGAAYDGRSTVVENGVTKYKRKPKSETSRAARNRAAYERISGRAKK